MNIKAVVRLPDECPNCESGPSEWCWGIHAKFPSAHSDWPVPEIIISCDACSETLATVDADVAAQILDLACGFGRGE